MEAPISVTLMQDAPNETVPADARRSPRVAALTRLVASFDRHAVGVCYWKSGLRLAAAMAGHSDLDLLADRADQHLVTRILLEEGWKPFPTVAQRDHPAITSFLGYDEPSGRLLHVHLHFDVMLGERLLKNYRLPFARSLLDHALPDPLHRIRVLDPADAAVLLPLRASLEQRWTDPVALRHWRATTRKFAADRVALLPQVDRGAFRRHAAMLLDSPTAALAERWMYGPAHGRGALQRHIRRALREYRTYQEPEARLRAVGRALHWLAGGLNRRSLHLPRPWHRQVPGGGRVVALLGVDGSGKTTVGAAIRSWLDGEVDVLPMYFGTGDGRPSLLLAPLKAMVPLATRLLRHKPRGASHGAVSGDAPSFAYGALLMLWSAVLAVEKRGKLRAARRAASRGLLVVTDRFPQDEIADYNDGPLLPRLPRVPRWLRRFEARSYALARQLHPDLVIKLEAPPDTLAWREPTMDPGVIRARVGALQRLAFPGAQMVRVDATQPLDGVVRAVKRAVWSLL